MNAILDTKRLLAEILEGRLQQGYDSEEVIQALAGTPTFALSALPRTVEEVEDRLDSAEELIGDVLQSALADSTELDEVRDTMLAALRTELMQSICSEREKIETWDSWTDEIKHLLSDYPPTFQYEAACLVIEKARLDDDLHLSDKTITGLIENLHSEVTAIQNVCAQALADIASEEPHKVYEHLEIIVGRIVYGPEELRENLLMAVVDIVGELSEEDTGMDEAMLVGVAVYCLRDTDADLVQTLAARILSEISKVAPAELAPAIETLQERRHDPRPAISDQVDEIFETLENADCLIVSDMEKSAYTPQFFDSAIGDRTRTTHERSMCPVVTHKRSDYGLSDDDHMMKITNVSRTSTEDSHQGAFVTTLPGDEYPDDKAHVTGKE